MTGLDVKSAYLYGELDVEIFMEQPEGFAAKGQEHKVLRLLKALYGLKQGGLAWWKALSKSMNVLGFKRLASDAGIFVCTDKNSGKLVIVVVYVDDAIFCGPDKAAVNKNKEAFMKKWECRDLGDVKEFLRMRIIQKDGNISLDQRDYLLKILKRFGMEDAKSAQTPLPAGYYPMANQAPVDPDLRSRYQQVIGSLLYLMLGTRPDIAFAVTKMAQFSVNPSQEHFDKALYICRYLAGTQNYALVFKGNSNEGLYAHTDSDWGSDPNTRKSQTGFFFKLADASISWKSHAQKTIALSSTEAEYMALSDCSRQAMWIKSLLGELGIPMKAFPIYGIIKAPSLFLPTPYRSIELNISIYATTT